MASSSLAPPSIMASSSLAPPSIMYTLGGRINFPRSSSSINLQSNYASTVKRRAIAIETSNHNNSDERMISGTAPWLMLPPVRGGTAYSFYSLTDKKVVDLELQGFGCDSTNVVGSSHGFLVLFDTRAATLFLYNPISGRRIDLPDGTYVSDNEIGWGPGIKKVIISEDESSAMKIFGPENRLASCTPGRSEGWTPLGPTLLGYTDVIYCKRRNSFMVTTKSNLEEWDLLGERNWLPHFDETFELEDWWWSDIKDLMLDECVEEPYVVFSEHSDQLYLVCRYIMRRQTYVQNMKRYKFPLREWDDWFPSKTIGFDVYKVTRVPGNNNKVELNYMDGSLDNLVMFIGINHSFALPADDYPELKRDSIYFTDHPEHAPLDCRPGICDTGIYYFNERTFFRLEYPVRNQNDDDMSVEQLWFTPSMH